MPLRKSLLVVFTPRVPSNLVRFYFLCYVVVGFFTKEKKVSVPGNTKSPLTRKKKLRLLDDHATAGRSGWIYLFIITLIRSGNPSTEAGSIILKSMPMDDKLIPSVDKAIKSGPNSKSSFFRNQ